MQTRRDACYCNTFLMKDIGATKAGLFKLYICSMATHFAIKFSDPVLSFCPPPFRRKAEGHSFWLSVLPSVLPSVLRSFRPPIGVCTLCAQLLLQFYSDSFETLQMSSSCFEDVHVVLDIILRLIFDTFFAI